MSIALKWLAAVVTVSLVAAGGTAAWYVHTKQPVRSGTFDLMHLSEPVLVAFDERGVPHIRAENVTDMYRALGYVHAKEHLFQMEMVRRLAIGELAEVLGPKVVDADRLFHTLGLVHHAKAYIAQRDTKSLSSVALLAYLEREPVSGQPPCTIRV